MLRRGCRQQQKLPNGIGGRIDTVVSQDGGYWFYEIKTAMSARACIRDALAQLLEYAYWPGAREASRLIIVGEPELDAMPFTLGPPASAGSCSS